MSECVPAPVYVYQTQCVGMCTSPCIFVSDPMCTSPSIFVSDPMCTNVYHHCICVSDPMCTNVYQHCICVSDTMCTNVYQPLYMCIRPNVYECVPAPVYVYQTQCVRMCTSPCICVSDPMCTSPCICVSDPVCTNVYQHCICVSDPMCTNVYQPLYMCIRPSVYECVSVHMCRT